MEPELIATSVDTSEYRLSDTQPLRLTHALGRLIECLSGTAWITVQGQSTDFFLRAGQVFEIPGDGLTLIEAVGASRIRVSQAGGGMPGWSARMAAQWRRQADNMPTGPHGAAAQKDERLRCPSK
ncbi:DUF2917 domain-containing protein [Oxalobacteraceae bacterium]|nr:DUF2917 domain-containing protein [Oxalobacteraceae bacterium]